MIESTPLDIKPFALERYFAAYEFSVRHLLSCSDCEPLGLMVLENREGHPRRAAVATVWSAFTRPLVYGVAFGAGGGGLAGGGEGLCAEPGHGNGGGHGAGLHYSPV